MKRGRIALLAASTVVILLLVGGGLGLKVGAADSSYGQVLLFSEVLSLVLDNYVDPVEAGELLQGAYGAMLTSLDAHGAYLSPDEVERWNAGHGHQLADPGVSVVKTFGGLQVVAVDPGSPADLAGVVAGDQIRRIDGRSLRELSLDQGLQLLRGEPGTTVSLSFLHPQGDLLREDLDLERAYRKGRPYQVDVTDGIGVLKIHDLARIDTDELVSELDDVRSRGVGKLLIDLRNAVEPDARKAVDLSALFVTGLQLQRRDRSGELLETIALPPADNAWPGPLGLLVNGGTAGAVEAVARLLQSRDGVKVFGEATYGLGAEAELFRLPDGSGLLVSVAEWETGSGAGWNGRGVEPDQLIRSQGSPLERAFADQLRQTLDAFDKLPPTAAADPKAA